MGSEIQLERMVLPVNGTDKMLNVIRLGRVTAFYQTQEGEYGILSQVNGVWQWEALAGHDPELELLFISVARGIRSGRFVLPRFWRD